ETIVEKITLAKPSFILAPWPIRRAKPSSSYFNRLSVPSPSSSPLHLLRRITKTSCHLRRIGCTKLPHLHRLMVARRKVEVDFKWGRER
ncbi:hypothetical protein HN51_058851, partial [Arachis hypogaea]